MRPLVAVLAALALALVVFFLLDRGGAVADAPTFSPGTGTADAGDGATPEERTPQTLKTHGGRDSTRDSASIAAPAAAGERVQDGATGGAAHSEDVRLVGRVVGPGLEPVGGAEVVLGHDDPLRRLHGGSSADLARATSDELGRFELGVSSRGALRLAVGAAGFAPHVGEVVVHAGARQDLGDIELLRGVVLSGRVVDEGGRGVPGAQIRRPGSDLEPFVVLSSEGPSGELAATADESGRFEIDRQAVGPFRFSVSSDEHPSSWLEGETRFPEERLANLIVTLQDGSTIAGRVLDLPAERDEELFVQAGVRMGEGGFADLSDLGSFSDGRRAELAPDGSFLLRGLRVGRSHSVELRARNARGRAGDWLGPLGTSRSDSVVAEAGATGVELRYSRGAALSFQVVDGRDGTPVSDYVVEAGASFGMPLLDASGRVKRKHPEGRARFEGLRARGSGGVDLTITAPGFERHERRGIRLPASGELDLGRIELDPAPLVRVTVRDASSGAELSGARVRLGVVQDSGRAEDSSGGERRVVRMSVSAGGPPGEVLDFRHEAESDENGLALLNSAPGERARVTVEKEGHAPWRSEVLSLPPAQDVELVAALSQGGAVLVSVVDSGGRVLAGIGVRHRPPGGGHSTYVFGGRAPGERISDEAGQTLFEHLAPGRHLFRLADVGPAAGSMGFVSVEMDGAPQGREGWTEVEVTDGGVTELELVAPERASLAGVVTEAGKPLAGATLFLEEPGPGDDALAGLGRAELPGFGGAGPSATTDGLGRYRIEGAKAGEWELRVSHPERAMDERIELELEGGKNRRDVALGVSIVEGRVLDEQERPIAGALVKAQRAQPRGRSTVRFAIRMLADDGGDTMIVGGQGGLPQTVRTDEDGRFSLRGVTPEVDLELEVSSEEHQTGRSEPFRVAADEIRGGVDVVLEGAGSIAVEARQRDGSPASMLLVRASYAGQSETAVAPAMGMTNARGVAELASLRPGPWKLEFERVGPSTEQTEVPEPRTVDVVTGERAEVEVDVP